MGYITPADVVVSDTRAGHVKRGSKEPGTDYATAYGTDLRAPDDGVIIGVDPNPGGAEGRRITFLLNNGEVIDWLHLSKIMMKVGQKIGRGTKGIALSGASGFGKDWHYGPHVHVTRRARRGLPFSQTLDFQAVAEAAGGNSSPAADLAAGERTAGGNGVRRRSQPTSKSPEAGEGLKPGTVGIFTGWVRGESVDGIDVWFQGISGNWFWAGGFTQGPNLTGLKDLNQATPPATTSSQRVTGPNGCRRRVGAPNTAAPEGESLAPSTVGNFRGWVRGESVEGIDVWFVGTSGDYFWAGGFTSQSTEGLTDLNTSTPPVTPPVTPPKNPDNPRGLPTYSPFYPGAFIGLEAPLGDGPRGQKGLPPNVVQVPVIIDQFHLHRTGSNGDDGDWFSYRNSRSSCPHLHVLQDGRTREFIRPKMKPALTGPDWNWRGYGIEIQGAGDGTAEQFERVADIMAWLASHEGRELDGVPVTYNLRTRAGTTLNHREMVPGTECPGDWWASRMDALLERARVILKEKYSPAPVDELPEPWRSRLEAIVADLNGILGR